MAENIEASKASQELPLATESTHHEPDSPEQRAAKRLKVDGPADSKDGANSSEVTHTEASQGAQTNGNGETASKPAAPADRRSGVAPVKKE